MFGKRKRSRKKSIAPNTITNGPNSVLVKTENFRLYVIRKTDTDEIIGTVLLTEGQQSVLNTACNAEGIKFSIK